jgi:hypothetical protein
LAFTEEEPMSTAKPSEHLSHWYHHIPGLTQSADAFYAAVAKALGEHNLKDTKAERVEIAEGGIFSGKREYLQVRRKEHVFHICAAPYGNGFFVSWWLGEIRSGLFAELASIPYVGFVFKLLAAAAKPLTYYRVDTALMFQSVTHGAVLSVLDDATNATGIRALTPDERKPIMKNFFERLGGGD